MVEQLTALLHNETALAIVAAVLALCATVLGLDGPHWERKFAAAFEDGQIRRNAEAEFYEKRPAAGLYGLVPLLALREPVRGRRARYVARAGRFESLPRPEKTHAVKFARAWLKSVGAFAEDVGDRHRVALRPFLATNHLAVIRQGVVIVPIAVSLLADGVLTEDEEVRLAWGLALMELAVRYNSITRQQREAVYFAAQGHEPAIGPVLRSPSSLRRPLYNVLDRASRRYRLRRLRFFYSRMWLNSVARQLQAAREHSS